MDFQSADELAAIFLVRVVDGAKRPDAGGSSLGSAEGKTDNTPLRIDTCKADTR